MYSDKKGFTLIELLIVVAIIGLLASIVMVSLNSAREKGRDARRMRDIEEIRTAIELYIADQGNVPNIYAAVDKDNTWDSLSTFLVPTYIKQLPKDPCGTSIASCITDNAGRNGNWLAYVYKSPALLISQGVDTHFNISIDNSTYVIMAENLESGGKSFGFGPYSF